MARRLLSITWSAYLSTVGRVSLLSNLGLSTIFGIKLSKIEFGLSLMFDIRYLKELDVRLSIIFLKF